MGGKRATYATSTASTDCCATSRAISPLALVDFEQARVRSTGWRRCRWRRRGRRRRLALGRPDLRHLGPPQHRTADARSLFELVTEAVWAAAGRRLAPPRPLLHALGQRLQQPDRPTGRQQDRFEGGSQRLALLMAEELGEELRRARCGGSSTAATRRRHADGGTGLDERAGEAGDRRRPSDDRRPHRYDPPLPACATSYPADAAGERDQDDGDLRGAVLAPGGAVGAGDERRGTGAGDLRQLASRRQPGVLLGFLEGRFARSGRRPAASGARRSSPATRAFGTRGRPSTSSSGLGRGGVDPRLLRLPDDHRRLDRIRPRPARADRPAALGRRRDRDRLERLHGRRRQLRRTRRRRSSVDPVGGTGSAFPFSSSSIRSPGGGSARRSTRRRRGDDLAALRLPLQPRGDVDDVADRGEVVDGVASPTLPTKASP